MLGNGRSCEEDGRLCRGKKEPKSHFYMYWAEHRRNYRNLLTHTLDRQPYISLKVLFLVEAMLLKAIISLSKELSIVFCAASETYYGVQEQYKIPLPRWERIKVRVNPPSL